MEENFEQKKSKVSKEKSAEYRRTYYEKHGDMIRDRQHDYYEANKEKLRKEARERYKKNNSHRGKIGRPRMIKNQAKEAQLPEDECANTTSADGEQS